MHIARATINRASLIGALAGTLLNLGVAQVPQTGTFLKPGSNVVLENVPPIPTSVAEETARYGQSRPATMFSWNPVRREMLIGTRFADTIQVHLVKAPGGARTQVTFFPDAVAGADFLPTSANSFVFAKDVGGGEWYQLYREDLASGSVSLLTDGKSRNGSPVFEHDGSRLAYTSTRRTGQDTDIYLMDSRDPKTDRMIIPVKGGGWAPTDFSRDGANLLIQKVTSVNESDLFLADVATGTLKQLTPPQSPSGKVYYGAPVFSKDGKGIYLTTDRDSDFQRLAYFDLATMTPRYLTGQIHWDIESFSLSEDGKTIGFVANEAGLSKLFLLDTSTGKYREVRNLPAGVIQGVSFHRNCRDLAFTLSSAKSPSDVYSVDVANGKIDRWTYGETGGLNPDQFRDEEPISWKSFDGLTITGFLTRPDPARFPGKRPVIILIHGGPEGQARPLFWGRYNYLINELGIAMIEPNVRGSTGFGKAYTLLDNGFHRDDTYKDVGALLDWIRSRPGLDPESVMVSGASYGGHMTWAVAAFYNDKIRCALPVVGMSNLVTFLEHTEAYRRDLRRVEYGDERDPAMRAYLEKIAPMNHLDSMHKPIFAIVGRNDPRVPWTESRQIIDKLNAQGTPTWFMIANDEGHGYTKKPNVDYAFNAQVMFVKKYLLGQD